MASTGNQLLIRKSWQDERQAAKALYPVPEAMAILSISRTVLYELIRSGRLRSVKQGRRRLIPATAIASYLALLEDETERQAA